MKLSTRLDENLSQIKLHVTSDDIEFMQTQILGKKVAVVFLKDTTDKNALGELVLRPLYSLDELYRARGFHV